MTLFNKIKLEKSHPKLSNELFVIETLTNLQYFSKEATMFLLYDDSASPTHSCSYLQYNLKLCQAHFKHEQSQAFSPDLHVTIGTIQQTQDTANVF